MAPRADFARLLELEQEAYEPLRLLGEAGYLWLYRGESAKARVIFEALIDLAPNDPLGHLGCCEVHLVERRARQADSAARQARRARNADHCSVAYAHLLEAKALLAGGRAAEAERALAEVLEVDRGGALGETARELIELLRCARETDGASATGGLSDSPPSPPQAEQRKVP